MISILALVAASWQALEARRANAIARESLLIEIEPTNISDERVAEAQCSRPARSSDGTQTVTVLMSLRWKITIFNASSLPVTLKSLEGMGESPTGGGMSWNMGPNGNNDWPHPVLLGPKEWTAYYLEAPTSPSPEFVQWFVDNGGCEGRIPWKDWKVRMQAGFFDGGWKQPGRSHLVVTVKTGTGGEFVARGTWFDNPSMIEEQPRIAPEAPQVGSALGPPTALAIEPPPRRILRPAFPQAASSVERQ